MPDLGLEVLMKGNNLLRLFDGLWIAVEISLLSIVISIPLGILLGILMTRNNRLVRFLTKFYLEFIRIMPQLVLLFLVFFGTTRSMGWNLPGETAAVIVFVMWGTAEMGDLVRSALLSIPGHQTDLFLYYFTADTPEADSGIHQSDYPYDKDYQPDIDDWCCGGVKGGAADYRG